MDIDSEARIRDAFVLALLYAEEHYNLVYPCKNPTYLNMRTHVTGKMRDGYIFPTSNGTVMHYLVEHRPNERVRA